MVPAYIFAAEKFAVTDNSLLLLKNDMPAKTIPFTEITSIEIRHGRDMANWLWVLMVGLALTGFGVWDLVKIGLMVYEDGIVNVYIERWFVPVIPLLLGASAIMNAMRNTLVMVVTYNNKVRPLSLHEIIKKGFYDSFIAYMQQRCTIVFSDEPSFSKS